eukprot:193536_1
MADLDSIIIELYSENLWIDRAQFFISIPITLFLFIFHIVHLVRSERFKSSITNKRVSTEHKINQVLTFSIFIGSLTVQLMCIVMLVGGFPYPSTNCNAFAHIGSAINATAKSLLYYIYVLRLQRAYKDSAFEYSTTTIYGLVIFITLYIVSSTVLFIFSAIYGGWIYDESEGIYWCQVYGKALVVGCLGLCDTVIQVICLVLFIKPLRHILKSNYDDDLKYVVIKVNVLTATAICTSLLFFGMLLLEGGGMFLGIDGGINLLCIMLMDVSYKYHYDLICSPCHSFVAKYNQSAPVPAEINQESPRSKSDAISVSTDIMDPSVNSVIGINIK